jgi:hypothetical protein
MQQNPNALCMYRRLDYHLTNAPHGLQKMEAHLDMFKGLLNRSCVLLKALPID